MADYTIFEFKQHKIVISVHLSSSSFLPVLFFFTSLARLKKRKCKTALMFGWLAQFVC